MAAAAGLAHQRGKILLRARAGSTEKRVPVDMAAQFFAGDRGGCVTEKAVSSRRSFPRHGGVGRGAFIAARLPTIPASASPRRPWWAIFSRPCRPLVESGKPLSTEKQERDAFDA